jgi:hypothetical protein
VQVLKAYQTQGVADGKMLQKRILGFGVNVLGLAALQLLIDVIASYASHQTAVAVGLSGVWGSGVGTVLLQTLSIYFAINAGARRFANACTQ